jgi:hypothetical protein
MLLVRQIEPLQFDKRPHRPLSLAIESKRHHGLVVH